MGLSDEQPPNENPGAQAEEGFDDLSALLQGVEYEEAPPEAPGAENFIQKLLGRLKGKGEGAPAAQKSQKKKGPLSQFKTWQKLVLAAMGVMLIIIYAAMITVVVTSLQATPPEGPLYNDADVINDVVTPTLEAEVELTPTLTPTPAETPTPTPTATPLPVSTRLDSQITVNPDNVDLRIERGNLYLTMGAYGAASRDFEHVLTVDPDNALAFSGIGKANFYLRYWTQAVGAYQQAIDRDPDLTAAHFGLATLLYYQNRYEAAAAAFDRAAEIDPDYVEAEAWLAISAARVGDATEAMGAAQRAISITERLPLVYIARSWAWRVQDPPDIDAALGDLLHAQNLEPFGYMTQRELAEFYLSHRPERLGEAANLAQYAYNWARSDLDRAQSLHTLGRVQLAQNRTEEARRTLLQAAEFATYHDEIILPDLAELLREVVPEN